MTMHYFAEDGSWGEASQISLVDTTEWGETDWAHVAAARDDNLLQVVHMVMFTRKLANGGKE